MKKFIQKASLILSSFALLVGVSTLSSACLIYYYQPEVPEGLDEFRK